MIYRINRLNWLHGMRNGIECQSQVCLWSIADLYKFLTQPSPQRIALVDSIRTLPDSEERNKKKRQLDVVCYNSIFKQAKDNELRLSGYFFIDIDDFNGHDKESIFTMLCGLDYINLVYHSASKGIHAVAKYELDVDNQLADREQIKKDFSCVFNYFKQRVFTDVNVEIDKQTSNPNRPVFIPYDKSAYLNTKCVPVQIDNTNIPEIIQELPDKPVISIAKTEEDFDKLVYMGLMKLMQSKPNRNKKPRYDNVEHDDSVDVSYNPDYRIKSIVCKLRTNKQNICVGNRNRMMLNIANETQSFEQYTNADELLAEVEYWNQKYCVPVLPFDEIGMIVASVFRRGVSPAIRRIKKGKFTANWKNYKTQKERQKAACKARKDYKFDAITPYLDCDKTIEENFQTISQLESSDPVIKDLLKKLSTPAKLRAFLVRNGVVFKGSKVCDYVKLNYDGKISLRKNAEKMGINKTIISNHLKTINSGKYEPYQMVLPVSIKIDLRASRTEKKSLMAV